MCGCEDEGGEDVLFGSRPRQLASWGQCRRNTSTAHVPHAVQIRLALPLAPEVLADRQVRVTARSDWLTSPGRRRRTSCVIIPRAHAATLDLVDASIVRVPIHTVLRTPAHSSPPLRRAIATRSL